MENECKPICKKVGGVDVVIIPTPLGTSDQGQPYAPKTCEYKNTFVKYLADNTVYFYDKNGAYIQVNEPLPFDVDDELSLESERPVQNKVITAALNTEIATRESADTNLQTQIDAISAGSDVVDVVDTYADLQNYDTSGLTENDIVKVLHDETRDNATAYYRWTSNTWVYVGSIGPYYTEAETDALLAAQKTELEGDIAAETTARQAADTALQADITAEATTRANADTALDGRITQEVTDRQAADTALDGRITAEATTRSDADAALRAAITAEVTARENGETTLRNAISGETTARQNADTALQGNIDAEASARQTADTTLQGNIDAEALARSNADTALGGRIDTLVNDLDRTVLYDLEMETDASAVTFVEDKIDVITGTTSQERDTIPTASATTAGTLSAAAYNSIIDSQQRLDALEDGAVALYNLPQNPTQQQLTTAWLTATSRTAMINRASIYDIDNGIVWTYYENITTWEGVSSGGSAPITPFTNSSYGTIMGSTTPGNVSANVDGTGTVAGWTALTNTVAGKANTADLATVATTGDYDDLINKPSITTVNDATLTIQKNGTNVATFTANSATNATANITVPTATSDLTNDSNFATTGQVTNAVNALDGQLATVAKTGNYNDLLGKPTIPTVNDATLTIQKNGVDVETFTANSAVTKTANITVPTSFSDLSGQISTANIANGAVTSDKVDWATLIDKIYPVGSIYMSTANVSPATFMGGTWVQIEDTFLLAAGTNHTAGSTGGAETVTLTTAEMPSHSHRLMSSSNGTLGDSPNSSAARWSTSSDMRYSIWGNNATPAYYPSEAVGGGQAHNNMPPYLTVYMWRRTA